jgi:flagellar basal body-associated protein FliL
MTTIINQPPSEQHESSSTGMIVGIVILVIVVVLVLFFGLPALRRTEAPAEQKAPAPEITIPDKIDVNIQQEGQGQ